MSKVTNRTILGRALDETRADLRLDKPIRIVTAIVVPLLSVGVGWWATRNVAWTRIASVGILLLLVFIVFIVKLFLVPVAIVKELSAEKISEATAHSAALDALQRRVAELTAPPARHPDGLYQFGDLVAFVTDARRGPGVSIFTFGNIKDKGRWDLSAEFEYREYVLSHIRHEEMISGGMMGSVNRVIMNAQAKIIRKRSI